MTTMPNHTFDDRNIIWRRLGDFEHFHYSILDIDQDRRIVDVLFKFAANQQIVLHRHLVHNNMLVIQGEHRLYEANGTLKEIRPVGRYTSSPPNAEPHREGGGDQDAVVLFSIRAQSDPFYEILDDELKPIATLGMQDFVNLQTAEQTNTGTTPDVD
jgi:quercetin dioxygenase-like cupin family protein